MVWLSGVGGVTVCTTSFGCDLTILVAFGKGLWRSEG